MGVYGTPAGHMMISTNQRVPHVASFDRVAMYSPSTAATGTGSVMTSQCRTDPNLNVSFSSVVSDVMTSDDETGDVNMNNGVRMTHARAAQSPMRPARTCATPVVGTGPVSPVCEKARVQQYKRQYHTLRRQSSSLLMCVPSTRHPPPLTPFIIPASTSLAHHIRRFY